MTGIPSSASENRRACLLRTVREVEKHVATGGWDGPVRLFALVRTATALARDPELSDRLPAEVLAQAGSDPEHLMAVEQEGLPCEEDLQTLLGRITWPDTVDGAAVVLERITVPPEAEIGLPEDEEQAAELLRHHPDRRDVRLAAAVLRDGTCGCAVRARDHDDDDRVAIGPDLIPGLVQVLAETLNAPRG